MNNKIYLSLVIASLFAGCSSSDIQDYIEDKIKNDDGLAIDTGDVANSIDDDISISGQEDDVVILHNDARNIVGVTENLSWDTKLVDAAQIYADEIAKSGVWDHDPDNQKNGYGENLYTSTAKPTLSVAAEAWIAESQYYTYGAVVDTDKEVDNTCVQGTDTNGNEIMCGHYTQVIWKDTSRFGCAMSQYETGNYKYWYVVVCKYQTPGNIVGLTPY